MRLRISEAIEAVVMLSVAIAAAAIVMLSLASCDAEPEQTWPESAEFSQIESGGDRFSTHDTNIPDLRIIVDHTTGIQYLYRYNVGMTPLLDVDGTPLRVLEAD